MKKIITRSIVLLAIVALVFGSLPTDSAQAAKKKSMTSITVSTQEELVKALKSGKYKKITIKTDAKVSFTLAAKYSSSDLKIVVDAKNATFNSKGTVGSIVVNEAKTVKEYASGNNITVNDEKLTFKAMGGASVEKLKIASETGEVKVVNNGEIGRVDVTGESKVDVEQNGSVGRLYVAAAAEIGVTGTSEEKLAVTVKPEAAGAAVKSELPVKVNAYADVDLQLEKGAENSAVTLKNEDAGVKLENNTDKKVTVTDSAGEKQTVKKGEDLTSDNYVGKPEETDDGTEGETSGTPSDGTEVDKKEDEDKEEEKKEDKEEEKKDDTTTETVVSGGDPSGGGSYPTPQEQLQNKLAVASYGTKDEDREAWLTQDLTLTKELIIPSGVCLVLDGHTLNAGSFVTLEPDASIWVTPGSNLVVDNDPFKYEPDNDGFTHAELTLEVNGVIKIGDYSIIGMGNEFDPIATRIIIENRLKDEKVPQNPDEEVSESNPEVALNFTERNVRFDYMGKSFDIVNESGSRYDFAKVFGGNRAYWVDDRSMNFDRPQNDEILTSLEINPLSNVLYDSREVTFNGEAIYSTTVGIEDWINAYLDPGMNWSAFTAVEQGKTVPSGITVPQTKDDQMVVTVTDNTIHFKKNVYVREEATLIANNIVYDETQPVAGPLGGDFQNAPGIRVAGNLIIDSITSAGFYGDNQELIKMQGANSTLKKGTRSYKVNTDDEWLKTDPYATAYSYCCWNATNQYYGYLFYTWQFEKGFELQASDNDTDYYEVVGSPVDSEPVRPGTPITAKDADQVRSVADSTSRWTNWGFADEFELADYPYAITDTLDFTAATIQSDAESATDGCGGKKLINIEPIEEVDENNKVMKDDQGNTCYHPVDFCGMKITVADDTMLQLNPGSDIIVQRGAELVIDGLTPTKSAGKNIYFATDDEGSTGRISVMLGGKITIGDYSLQTLNHGNDHSKGEFCISIDAWIDKGEPSNNGIRFQIPEDVIITKNGVALTESDIADLSTWARTNNYRLEICNSRSAILEAEGGRIDDEFINYFPSIKVGDSYLFTDFTNGTLVKGEYTKVSENEYSTGSVEGLKAIWTIIERPSVEDENVEPLWSTTINLTANINLEHITMKLPGTINLNGYSMSLANNANITANVIVPENSSLDIGNNCKLGTSMGGETVVENNGHFTIKDGGVFSTQMGSKLRLASGAAFQINDSDVGGGVFYVGCEIKGPAQGNGHVIWFENPDGVAVINVGPNARVLIELELGEGATDPTQDEKNTIVNEVKALLHNDSIDVRIYEPKPMDPRT